MIRLLIAAHSAVVRAGLQSLAASSVTIEVLGAFPDWSAVDVLRPDVVLAALPAEELPPPENGGGPAIVLLSSSDETRPAWSPDLLRLGVRALLSHQSSPAEILGAIEAAAAGFAAMDPRELERLLASAPESAGSAPGILTPRELEVLRMMADGAANKTIAWKLDISEHTVKFHVASILSKLNASTRTEAVTIGVRLGLVML